MKIITNFCLTISLLIFLFSCGNDSSNNNGAPKPETPKALQESNSEIKMLRSEGSDLTDELYNELVDKTPSLKKLEEDIDALNPKQNELDKKFNKYNDKSNSYYSSAKSKMMGISDSLLKKKIDALISNSINSYSIKTAELNSLLEKISKNEGTLNDRHLVLKIVLTLPLIEKYQKENVPDKKEFKDFAKEQEKFIERIDSLTPKY